MGGELSEEEGLRDVIILARWTGSWCYLQDQSNYPIRNEKTSVVYTGMRARLAVKKV